MLAETEQAGELIVQNGKKRGTALKLRLPITTIGSSAQCDIRITGPGITEVHAIITDTPAGLVLRSFHTENTLVNGAIVSSRLLRTGDELTLGPAQFRLNWHEADLIPLSVAPPDEEDVIPLWIPTADSEWSLEDRLQSLQAQERYLGQVYHQRSAHLSGLVQELAQRREEIRQLKAGELAGVTAQQAETQKKFDQAKRLAQAARADRLRARQLYQRYTKRLETTRQQLHEEHRLRQQELQAAEAKLQHDREQFQQLQSEQNERWIAEQARLKQAWALVQESQRRLLIDRQSAEELLQGQANMLTAREQELMQMEATARQGQERVETRVHQLVEEIQKLEQRAGVSRQIVQRLEEQRAQLESNIATVQTPMAQLKVLGSVEAVPLQIDMTRSAEEFLTSLAVQERDLVRERLNVSYAQQELERQAAALHDQRTVVAEQLQDLLLARDSWKVAQMLALQELESLAIGLDERECLLERRHNEFQMLDQARRHKEQDLLDWRNKLEAWQLQLSSHEALLNDARTAQEQQLRERTECLSQSEAALLRYRERWTEQMQAALVPLQSEIEAWSRDRDELSHQREELEQFRLHLIQQSARVSSQALALEQTQQEVFGTPVGALAERRMRVFQKYWERHFDQAAQHLHALSERSRLADQAAQERLAALAAKQQKLHQEQHRLLQAHQALEQDRLAYERQQAESARVLQFAEAQAMRSAESLQQIQREAERFQAKVQDRQFTALPGWGQKKAA